MSLALRFMTRVADRLECDLTKTQARAAAGADIRTDVARLERRARRAVRLTNFLRRRAA